MRFGVWFARAFIISTVALACGAVAAADLPSSTKKQLAQFKLDESLMSDIDKELAIPQAWLDAAKKEPPVQVLATWNPSEWKTLSQSFYARYPSIKIDYVRSSRDNRQVQTLLALKQGRYVGDVITSFSSIYKDLREMNALADLHELPAFGTGIADSTDPDGYWASERITYWCIAYNTDLVKPSDLPKDWDDILTNPFWRDGHFAVSNTAAGWMTVLYKANGREWARNFLTKLFVDVKPKRRNEGRDASVQLTAAGEQAAVTPSGDYRVAEFARRGAPVSFHCPSIVPMAAAQIGLLRGSPAQNGGKIFLNWFLSKEGQLGLHAANGAVSAHKDLQIPALLNYPEQVRNPNKKIVIDDLDMAVLDELQQLWTKGWNNELPGQ
ncbi:MAG TPA: extracellular solute-binding protein [Alphaproteobacteria bacterium]|jgi:ABC-type Fe3+ transport system substrate-binding protein|nr:extracellular solute-binding protein [Alphaproteobacteria bacterium]